MTLKSKHLGKKTKFYFESEESLKSLNKPVEFSVSDGMNSEKIFINLSETPVKENVIKFLFFAFIGGIILNFMPCVFPVLSIKVMSMIQLKEVEKLQIKKILLFGHFWNNFFIYISCNNFNHLKIVRNICRMGFSISKYLFFNFFIYNNFIIFFKSIRFF